MGNGKRKGSSFEREVAKLLSAWWSPKKYEKGELVFWRTHSSGAVGKKGKREIGDIMAIDPEGEPFTEVFTVECKRSRRFNLFGILTDEACPLRKWWRQTWNEAAARGNEPMLIFKLDRYPVMVALKPNTMNKLGIRKYVRISQGDNYSVCLWEDFVGVVDKEKILEYAEKRNE